MALRLRGHVGLQSGSLQLESFHDTNKNSACLSTEGAPVLVFHADFGRSRFIAEESRCPHQKRSTTGSLERIDRRLEAPNEFSVVR